MDVALFGPGFSLPVCGGHNFFSSAFQYTTPPEADKGSTGKGAVLSQSWQS
jgi:hypothetical protein